MSSGTSRAFARHLKILSIAPLQGTSRSSYPSSLSRLSSPAHNSSFPSLLQSILIALLTSPISRLHSLALPPDLCISFHKPSPYLPSCHLSPLISPLTFLYLRLRFVFALLLYSGSHMSSLRPHLYPFLEHINSDRDRPQQAMNRPKTRQWSPRCRSGSTNQLRCERVKPRSSGDASKRLSFAVAASRSQ